MTRTTLALLVLLALAPAARAGTLATPPVVVSMNENTLCQLTNLGAKTVRAVFVELVEFPIAQGGTVIDSSVTPSDVVALGSLAVDALYSSVAPVIRACRFTFKGSGKDLRASIVRLDSFAVIETQAAH